ncbi:MAG: VWA domain-containing protein [Candidatus Kryptonium sp.]|nr:VWA domain-containing protein [Candidatus Kryptonium sp.]MDW8109865.1 VWA domain-containing protein [Candidatus Kryptonium sp.]
MGVFSLNANLIIALLAVLVSVGVGLISYYRVSVPGERSKIIFLFILRVIAVFISFLLISEPILTLILRSSQSPSVAILIDNSKSMGIQDRLGDRKKQTKEIVEKLTKIDIKGDKRFFVFSGDVEEKRNFNVDSLSFSGGLTDIARALRKIQSISTQENIKAVILVSDGIYNAGENPVYFAEKVEIPIFTVGVGDSTVQKDLKVIDVLANEVAYAGVETPIVARIGSAELGGSEVIVSLHDEKSEISREKLKLDVGVNEYVVNFKFIPKEEGLKKFVVKVQHLPGEVTYQNNQKSFYVKVLRSKYKILLVSGAPSPDLAFVKRVLVENKNYEVISYTEKRGREFIEGNFDFKNAETADAVVFVGYPVKTSDVEIINRLKNVISAQNKPFFFLISRTVDFDKLRIFSDVLPFRFSRVFGDEEIVNLVITEDGRNHSITDLKDKNNIWNMLPPVFKLRGVFNAVSGTIVLAKAKYQNIETDEPLIVVNRFGDKKSVAVLCYGIWRWKLMTAQNREFDGFFETFVNNLVRWLIAPVEEEFVKFKITKNFYSEDEEIKFSAQVYNEDYSPINDAEVEVKILSHESGEIIREIELENVSPGVYSGGINLLRGDYRYEASILRRGKVLRNFSGRFTVGEAEVEFLNTRMDAKLLREIATRTGGVFISSEKVDTLGGIINSLSDFKPAIVERKMEYILWSRFEPLAIVIILLSIEWFMRKRMGLA